MTGETGHPRHRRMAAAVAAFALVVTACAPTTRETIRIGVLPWAEVVATAHLWEVLLTGQGYDVELVEVDTTSPGGIVRSGEVTIVDGVYALLAAGEIDVWTGAWLPQTHAPQLAAHGDGLDNLGTWYEGARLTWAVPAGLDVDEIGDLAGRADEFGGEIVGIEPGSGHVRITRQEVLPAYGLDDEYTLTTGSTRAMLDALGRAVALERPIVVTLWRPHPAYGRYDLRDLADPLGALGEPERIDVLVRAGLAEDHPDIAECLGRFALDEASLTGLQAALEVAPTGAEQEVVADWLRDHRRLVDGWGCG